MAEREGGRDSGHPCPSGLRPALKRAQIGCPADLSNPQPIAAQLRGFEFIFFKIIVKRNLNGFLKYGGEGGIRTLGTS